MAVLVGVMPWRNAGVSESPFVTVFKVAGIPAAGFIMNFVVLSAALSGANASLYATSRMLFSIARSGYAPQRMGVLNRHGVPMGALLASMLGIVAAIVLQFVTPRGAYLYIIGAALVGGMLAWLISLLAHIRFRKKISRDQLADLPLRSPLGAAGSVFGFIAILAAILLTWRVEQSRITVLSAGPYLLILTVAYLLVQRNHRANSRAGGA
jgi:L-asparagine transporter-like permease